MIETVAPKAPTPTPDRPSRYQEIVGLPSEQRWAWLEIDLDEAFTAAFRIAVLKNGAAVAEVRVFPTRPVPQERGAGSPPRTRPLGTWTPEAMQSIGAGVPTRILRKVKAGDAAALAVKWALAASSILPPELGPMTQAPAPPRRARGPRDRQLLELVAALYLQARRDGSRSPARDVWERLGEGRYRYERATVRDLIAHARREGLLPPVATRSR